MGTRRCTHNGAFSLLELVIVVAIIAILAAIGIPRLSRGTRGASDAALSNNLALLRNAIDIYAAEHSSTYPAVGSIANQLTQYTNETGEAQVAKDSTHYYGPYMRSIPPLPVGVRKGCTNIAAADANDVGWIYTESTGEIRANTAASEKDDANKLYSDY